MLKATQKQAEVLPVLLLSVVDSSAPRLRGS
jgi:hypothetical protein